MSALKYKVTTRTVVESCVETTLKVPTHWSMYTKAGNRRITGFAKTLYDKAVSDITLGRKLDALLAFKRSWYKLCVAKAHPEASDTDVKECVQEFFEKVAEALKFDGEELWCR